MVAIPATGFAHNLWLNAVDYSPELSKRTGAHTKLYFGFGHKFPVHDFLDKEKLVEFKLIKPDGKTRDLEPGEGGYMATPLILKKEGAHVVAAATKTGFYTMYFEGKGVHHKLGSKEGLEKVLLSLYYENYTKALIDVGETANDAYAAPVGHNIEIVPMENPYLKKVGETLDLKVLYKGRPAPFCNVSATYVGFSAKEDYAYSNKANSRGISTIRLLNPGQWVVRAVVRKPAKEELREKCNEEKYSATISFEVK
jgi:uncharacterized GH25 family protein